MRENTQLSETWKLWRAPTTLVLQLIQETEVRWQNSLSQLRTSEGRKSKCLSWIPLWIPLNQISCSYFPDLKHNWHCSLLTWAWFSTHIVLDVRMDFAEDSGGVITSWGDMHCMSSQTRSSCFCARLEHRGVRIKVNFSMKAFFFFCSLQFKDSGIELECIPDVCQTQNEYYIESTQEKSEMRTWAAEMHGKLNPGRKVWQDYSWPEEKFKSIQSIKLKKSLGKCCSNSWSEESRIWLCHREKHPYLVCQMDLGFLAQTLNTGLEEVTQVHRENR